jgi:hypothetical protein
MRDNHEAAVASIAGALREAGYACDGVDDSNGLIHVTAFEGKPIGDVTLEVHADTYDPDPRFFVARSSPPPEDPRYLVAFVVMAQRYYHQYLILSNAEARACWTERERKRTTWETYELRTLPFVRWGKESFEKVLAASG